MNTRSNPTDRAMLRAVLTTLAGEFPKSADGATLSALQQQYPPLHARLEYLAQHGLATYRLAEFSGDVQIRDAKITAAGMDWLAPDGGMTADKRVIIVRMEDETLRKLLIERIESSDASQGVKTTLIDKIRSLPAETLSALAAQAVQVGIAHLPHAVRWLRTALGG